MAVLRPHLALTVSDVERAIPFYSALFGAAPAKVRPGYAKFEVAEPALNFTYARQDKIWVRDPDGTPWEVFVVKGEAEHATEVESACCAA